MYVYLIKLLLMHIPQNEYVVHVQYISLLKLQLSIVIK